MTFHNTIPAYDDLKPGDEFLIRAKICQKDDNELALAYGDEGYGRFVWVDDEDVEDMRQRMSSTQTQFFPGDTVRVVGLDDSSLYVGWQLCFDVLGKEFIVDWIDSDGDVYLRINDEEDDMCFHPQHLQLVKRVEKKEPAASDSSQEHTALKEELARLKQAVAELEAKIG